MNDEKQPYRVSIYELSDAPGVLAFTFVPMALRQPRVPGELPIRVPQYIVAARGSGEGIAFDWGGTPDDPGEKKAEIEDEARRRVDARQVWIDRIEKLVADVEQWGGELGWRTRRIEKRLDDWYVGKHRLPALLMQEETFRILLEPVGRSAPGTEGIVDLYLLPAYDDITTLYYYDGRWNIHYAFRDVPDAENIREMPAIPLSKESLRKVLEDMRTHAV